MSVIDKVLQGQTPEATTLTLREAAATLLVAAITSDGAVAPEEGARLNALLSSMRLYKQTPPQHLQPLINAASDLIAREGVEALLPACAPVIPQDLRPSFFALVVELVFADGRIAEREKRFVDAVQAALAIDDETATKIVEVLLIKARA